MFSLIEPGWHSLRVIPFFAYSPPENILEEFQGVLVGAATLEVAITKKSGGRLLLKESENSLLGKLYQMPESGWRELEEALGQKREVEVLFWGEPVQAETFAALPSGDLRRFRRQARKL